MFSADSTDAIGLANVVPPPPANSKATGRTPDAQCQIGVDGLNGNLITEQRDAAAAIIDVNRHANLCHAALSQTRGTAAFADDQPQRRGKRRRAGFVIRGAAPR